MRRWLRLRLQLRLWLRLRLRLRLRLVGARDAPGHERHHRLPRP
jgi:hypothetical protein